jgi:DNA mismatch endonuclease (patch repair protein)
MSTPLDPMSARSQNMSLIRSQNTRPEMVVRRAAHSLGYRFTLHDPTLPGTPDIVFGRRMKVIFVHGCFWHQHDGCKRSSIPKSRMDYWVPKLQRNKNKDQSAIAQLSTRGWEALVIWECELKDQKLLLKRLSKFLGPPRTIKRPKQFAVR